MLLAARDEEVSWAISQVESNDDLLTIILVRLPPNSIFKFRCVSKRWKRIVATPTFLESYRKRKDERKYVIALIQKSIVIDISREPIERYINILSVAQTHNIDHQQIDTSSKLGTFISSSNGLILCGRYPEVFHVFNPLTRKKVRLPPPRVCKSLLMTLVCEKSTNLVPNYKVIVHDDLLRRKDGIDHHYFTKPPVPVATRYISKAWKATHDYFSEAVNRYFTKPRQSASEAETHSQKTILIETYSSSTGKWVTSKLAVAEAIVRMRYEQPLMVDGIIHWHVDWFPLLAIYDSNGDDGNHVQLIELPRAEYYSSAFRSSREDPLWYGKNHEGCLQLWVLPRGESTSAGYKRSSKIPVDEWVLCSTIRYNTLSNGSTNFDCVPRFDIIAPFHDCNADSPFVLEEIIPWKPCMFALLTREKKFYLLNLETRSIELVQYHGDDPKFTGQCYDFGWFAYLEPFCLSSYAI